MFGQRLKQLRKEHGITQEKLASIIGVERSSIGKYEGKSGIVPSDDVKYRIATFFDVTVDYMMGYTDNPRPLSNGSEYSKVEIELIECFRALNEEGRSKLIDYADDLVQSGKYKETGANYMGKEA